MGIEPPPVDPDDARRAADDILSRPEYREPGQSIVDRALEWLFEQFGNLFERLGGSGPGSVIGWIVLAALVGGALWLLIRALRVPLRSRAEDEPGVIYGTETHRDASVWLAEADRLAAAGDHRGALRCRHQALVATAITLGRVDHVAGRTAAEYGDRLARALPGEAERIDAVTERFEAAWYGGAAVDRAGYDGFVADAAVIETGLERAGATA